MKKLNKMSRVQRYLNTHPNTPIKEVAAKLGVHLSLVYKARKLQSDPVVNSVDAMTIEVSPGSGTVDLDPASTALLLTNRGHTYGKFKDRAAVTQDIKRAMARHAHAINKTFSDSQWQALEMIAEKMGRIVNGDPSYVDNWRDIAGYAQLVADELQGIER